MSKKVKVSQQGEIQFEMGDSIPTTPKKFRKSPEITAFYKFIFEHDLQREASAIIDFHVTKRKKEKSLNRKKRKKKDS